MVTDGNRETNMVAMVAVKANSESYVYHMLGNVEKEKLVIDLYYNQQKNVRQIAQEARISFRDITAILKKNGAAAVNGEGNGSGNGIVAMDNQQQQMGNGSSQSNQKSTQAYKLFSKGKTLIQVSIELGLREKEASRFFMEFLKLKRQYRLYQIYSEIEPSLPSFLKLHKALKERGMNPNNVDGFADAIETGSIKLPELQGQYQSLQNRVWRM